MTLALVLAALLALAVVLFVARPFLREPTPVSDVLDSFWPLVLIAAATLTGSIRLFRRRAG